MTLKEAPLQTLLTVTSIGRGPEVSDLESRLMHLGFIEGAKITIRKKSSFFKEPLLVEVRGRLVALSSSEGELIGIEVL